MTEFVKTTCPYCGVGCGILAMPKSDGSVDIKGDPEHPANFGRLCSKGAALGETMGLEGRLLKPEIDGAEVDWNTALDHVADGFSQAIKEHGPDSVAFYVSGQILTEDYYLANKLMKGFIGSANIDTNSRLCMASSVAGHKRAFGSDTVPGTYEDLELADLIVLVGSNLAWCHPVLYQRIAAAKAARPHMKIVLIDPRRTMTADIADLHLAIEPDGDTALFNGLLAHLVDVGKINEDFITNSTIGMSEALATARFSDVLAETGLEADEIASFYSLFSGTQKTVTVYSQGVNQSVSGTDKVNAIINCHLATGRIGRPGMGPFSVTGQPNAMGGREVGGLANMLAAHMDIENPKHREIVSDFWDAPDLATKPGLKAVELFDAVAEGRIKALWIMATNPVDSLPNAGKVEAAITACPFVVVSDVLENTDTVRHAHVKLPSLAWGEKDGTVTNSERRISRQRAFLPVPGEARADWWQVAQVAQRMGFARQFLHENSADIFKEHAVLSDTKNDGSRDFDIGGLSTLTPNQYETLTPQQWPLSAQRFEAKDGRMFQDGRFFTADRRARFVAVSSPQGHIGSKLVLNTGRVRDHWHTMTRTGQSARNSAHIAEPFCEIHPADALRLGICDASLVDVENDLGRVRVRAQISHRQKQGCVFVPMHWNDQFASSARIDRLVPSITDPISGQPASKNVPVSVSSAKVAKHGFLICRNEPDFFEPLSYWAKAKSVEGWRLEFAMEQPGDVSDLLIQIAQAKQPPDITYGDPQKDQYRQVWLDGEDIAAAIFVSSTPVTVSRSWAAQLLTLDRLDPMLRARITAGRPSPDQPDKGAIVCSCFVVGANDIHAAIEAGCRTVSAIGKACNAGTNCGSCRSEINGLLNEHFVIAAE